MGNIQTIECDFYGKTEGKKFVITYNDEILERVVRFLQKDSAGVLEKKCKDKFDVLCLSYGMKVNEKPAISFLVGTDCAKEFKFSKQKIQFTINRKIEIYVKSDMEKGQLNASINLGEEKLEDIKRRCDAFKHLNDVNELEVVRFDPDGDKEIAEKIALYLPSNIIKNK